MSAMPALIKAAFVVNIRQPATILFGFVMPIAIIVIFNFIGGGLFGDGAVNQVVPGILAYSVANAALSASAMTFTAWRLNGLLSRLRLEPVSAIEVITSRFVVAAVVTVLQAVVFVVLGVAFLGMEVSSQFLVAVIPFSALPEALQAVMQFTPLAALSTVLIDAGTAGLTVVGALTSAGVLLGIGHARIHHQIAGAQRMLSSSAFRSISFQ